MCFVFKTAVVFLCKERLRQKKKSIMPVSSGLRENRTRMGCPDLLRYQIGLTWRLCTLFAESSDSCCGNRAKCSRIAAPGELAEISLQNLLQNLFGHLVVSSPSQSYRFPTLRLRTDRVTLFLPRPNRRSISLLQPISRRLPTAAPSVLLSLYSLLLPSFARFG